MQLSNECLDMAMFIASESYSGSVYEVDFFAAMDGPCDEVVVFTREYGGNANISAAA